MESKGRIITPTDNKLDFISQYAESFKNHGYQPEFFHKVSSRFIPGLKFNPQHSTTEKLIQNNKFYVKLMGTHIPLNSFNTALRSHDLTLYFDASSPNVSCDDFKVVKISDINKELKDIPSKLTKRARSIDA